MSGVGFPIVTKVKDSSCCHIPPVSKSRHSTSSIYESRFDDYESPYKVANRAPSQEQQRFPLSTPTGAFMTAIGTDCDQVLEATLTLYYYNMISCTSTPSSDTPSSLNVEGEGAPRSISFTTTTTTFVELHLCCSVLGRAFSSHNQQHATCRIPVAAVSETWEECDSNYSPIELASRKYQYIWSDVIPSVVFSSGGTFIACLVPHPIRIYESIPTHSLSSPDKDTFHSTQTPSLSSVVIFSVNKTFSGERLPSPCNGHSSSAIPLPSYVTQSLPKQVSSYSAMERRSEVPSLSHPRVVSIGSSPSDALDYAASKVHQVTCICNMKSNSESQGDSKSSLLLAGCTDGSILAIGYRKARLLHIWIQPSVLKRNDTTRTRAPSINDLLWDTAAFTASSKVASSKKAVPWNNSDQGILFMAHNQYVHKDLETVASQSQKRGTLVVIRRDGEAICFSTWYHLINSSTALQQNEDSLLEDNPSSFHRSIQTQDLDGGENEEETFVDPNIHSSEFVLHKQRGVILRISPLPFTFHASAKKVPSSRRPYYRCLFVDDHLIAFLVHPVHPKESSSRTRDSVIADIWYLRDQSGTSSLISEFSMNEEELREAHHDVFTSFHHILDSNSNSGEMNKEMYASVLFSGIQISCDSRTKCIVINSAIQCGTAQTGSSQVLRFCALWDFISNVYGLTLVREQTIRLNDETDNLSFGYGFSLLQFSQFSCAQYGPLIHIYLQGKRLYKIRYDYSVAMPPDSRSSFSLIRLDIASPLMTSSGSISFPELLFPSFSRDFSVKWSEVSAPNHMISCYGQIKLSSIGRSKGRSIAIACDRGFSILDISSRSENNSRKKVPLYSVEQGIVKTVCVDFGVGLFAEETVAQRNRKPKWRFYGSSQEERGISVICMTWWERVFEDLLIAVVLYDSAQQGTDRPFLACWSSKRMGSEHQLMTSDGMTGLGVLLPPDISPMMISVFSEPVTDSPNYGAKNTLDERAVVLISELREEGLVFSIFHIQAAYSSMNGNNWSTRRLFVLAKLHIQGHINFSCGPSYSPAEVDGKFYSIFISGASFRFNLNENEDQKGDGDRADAYVTLAILMDFGEMLYALNLMPSQREQPFLVYKSTSADTNIVSRVWLAGAFDLIDSSFCYNSWTFALSSGGSFSWFVPSVISRLPGESRNESNTWYYNKELLLGQVSYERDCLKLRSCESGSFLFAPLPCSAFRYILYLQQRSRLVKTMPMNSSHESRQKIFGVGDFILGTPTFISSIYHIISELSSSLNKAPISPSPVRKTLESLLRCFRRYDSLRAALGAILPFVVDMVYTSSQVYNPALALSKMLLIEIISGTREVLSPLEFVCLYINIGRLLEPHHFDCLFPLPLEDTHPHIFAILVSSLDDMVSLCTMCGSAKLMSSTLTMKPTKYSSHVLCNRIFHHYITTILKSVRLESDMQANVGLDDLPYIMQLYRYSLKLEDSNNFNRHSMDGGGSTFSVRERETNVSSLHAYSKHNKDQMPPARLQKSQSHQPNGVELAIANAASSFILSGSQTRSVSMIPAASIGSDFIHIVLAKLLIAELVFRDPAANNHRKSWKLLALISKLLENEISESHIQTTRLRNLCSKISSEELIIGLHVGRSHNNTYPPTKLDITMFVQELFQFSSSFLSFEEMLALNKVTTTLLLNEQESNDFDATKSPLIFLLLATCHASGALRDYISCSENVFVKDIVSNTGTSLEIRT